MSEPTPGTLSKKGTWPRAIGSFLFSILLVLTIRWLLLEAYVIPSGSMLPTLLINDHIFVNKLTYGIRWPFSSKWIMRYRQVKRGDVVVFRSVGDPDIFMVKRVIGLGGDKIEYMESGELQVNGEPLLRHEVPDIEDVARRERFDPEKLSTFGADSFFWEQLNGKSYLTLLNSARSRLPYSTVVPDGHLFVMGDNRDNSSDSRFWGFVPIDNLLGSPMFIWLSCDSEDVHAIAQCSAEELRWDRFGHWVK